MERVAKQLQRNLDCFTAWSEGFELKACCTAVERGPSATFMERCSSRLTFQPALAILLGCTVLSPLASLGTHTANQLDKGDHWTVTQVEV
jgi:hypothetical protein